MMEQKGRSMIEMLGVLSIMGVLSVAGINGYSKAMAKYRAVKAIDQVYQITAGLKRTFGAQHGYDELSSDAIGVATKLGIIPDEMLKGGNIRNAFGGGVDLAVVTVDGKENGGFVLTFSGLPREGVVTLAKIPWDMGSNTLLNVELNAENTTVEINSSNTKKEISNSDLDSIKSGNENKISWIYK